MNASILTRHTGQIALAGLLCLCPLASPAGVSVTLVWQAPEILVGEPALAGFHIHYGTQSRESAPYDDVAAAGLLEQMTVSNLVRGQVYYFAVTASNENGAVSGYSEEIAWSHGDLDTDGMQDEWEQDVLGLDPAVAAPDDDSDQDGMSNAEEFTAGTDPQDAQSRSEVRIRATGSRPAIEFTVPTISGPWYEGLKRIVTLERSSSLGAPWVTVEELTSAPSNDQSVFHYAWMMPEDQTSAFYRTVSVLVPKE